MRIGSIPRAWKRSVGSLTGSRRFRVLLIVTFRPEFEPPWIGRPHVTALTINRLAQRDIERHDRPRRRQQAHPGEHPAGHHRAHRRHSAVRRGNDQGGAGSGKRRRGAADRRRGSVPRAGGPRKLARVADGAARPARPGQGGGADRRSDRPRVLPCLLAAVARKPEAELASALDRLIAAGLLFRQGVPPHATYLFKHALVQDAAYGTLLREPRRALHARIAEALESQFAEIAENQPELLARHCTEAGLIEKAAVLWGKAGQRSLAALGAGRSRRNSLTRALDQIAALPGTPRCVASRSSFRSRCRTRCSMSKGYAAPETKACSTERARCDRTGRSARRASSKTRCCCSRSSTASGSRIHVAFNGDVCASLRRSSWRSPRSKGRRSRSWSGIASWVFRLCCVGTSRGRPSASRSRDRALRSCRASSAGDAFSARRPGGSLVLSVLGPVAAWLSRGRARRHRRALKDAREIGQAATLMFALSHASPYADIYCGDYAGATRAPMNLSLWRTKKALCLEGAWECCCKAASWP